MNQQFDTTDLSDGLSSENSNKSSETTTTEGVVFNERRRKTYHNNGVIISLLIEKGFVKNEKSANTILITLAVLMFILAIYIWTQSGSQIPPIYFNRGAR